MNPPGANLVSALQASKFGRGLNAGQIATLGSVFRLASYPGGAVLAFEGQPDNDLHAVVSGSLAVVRSHGQADATPLGMVHVGDSTHELGFIDGSPRYASLVAATPTSVLELERRDLESLVQRDPALLFHVMCVIVRSVHESQARASMQTAELTNYIVKQHGRY